MDALIAHCETRLPRWLPWQVEATAAAVQVTVGWGLFRRVLRWPQSPTRIDEVAHEILVDLRAAADGWLTAHPAARALAATCTHPTADRTFPSEGQSYCLRCGAKL